MPSKKKTAKITAATKRRATLTRAVDPGPARSPAANFTLPGLSRSNGDATAHLLQERLTALIDLELTLKHIHWNVVGPDFIGVHLMLDPQVDGIRAMVDATAERIAALGSSPNGLVGHVVETRSWDDYSLSRALVPEHLGALDVVYSGVIESHRAASTSSKTVMRCRRTSWSVRRAFSSSASGSCAHISKALRANSRQPDSDPSARPQAKLRQVPEPRPSAVSSTELRSPAIGRRTFQH